MLFLAFGALASPWPWASLWFIVPVVVAASMLLAWRFGRPALAAPAALLVAALGLWAMGPHAPLPYWFTLWTPVASAVGAWMGLREEGGGPGSGERAWMFAPLLLLAASLPVLPGFSQEIVRLDTRMLGEQQRLLASAKPGEVPPVMQEAVKQSAAMPAADRQKALRWIVPNLLFVCTATLTVAGRALGARVAAGLGWPPASSRPLLHWRLPDAALVPLIVGIALLAFANPEWHPSALTLLVHVVLGYSVQGVAVVESMLISRGMPPAFVALTMLFVIAVSLLWILPVIAVLGLSDVWLDYRRLEPSEGEA